MSPGASPSGKSPTALRSIGEVVAETGVAAHVLRYWERQVAALRPVRRAGDRRYYRAEDVALISRIARLIEEEGYTLEGAARAATSAGRREKASSSPAIPAAAPQTAQGSLFAGLGSVSSDGAISLARLRSLRDRLQAALAAA